MVTLRLLWVNDCNAGPREAWMAQFATACRLHEIDISQLAVSVNYVASGLCDSGVQG